MNQSISDFIPFSLNLRGELKLFERPQVMGILNVTTDSFYAGSRTTAEADIERRVMTMLEEGADFIDIGAYSSRPGASDIPVDEEIRRIRTGMEILRRLSPDIPVSVDTFRAKVARIAVEECGVDIVNDISGGLLDQEMADTVVELKVPYILMHMRGTPDTMQGMTDYSSYGGVTEGVINELWDRVEELSYRGVADIIIDPGFGFAKTVEQNYRLFSDLPAISLAFNRPVLVGVSRKSMIYRPLAMTPENALPGSIALATIALQKGASILRVHDVGATVQALKTILLLNSHKQ